MSQCPLKELLEENAERITEHKLRTQKEFRITFTFEEDRPKRRVDFHSAEDLSSIENFYSKLYPRITGVDWPSNLDELSRREQKIVLRHYVTTGEVVLPEQIDAQPIDEFFAQQVSWLKESVEGDLVISVGESLIVLNSWRSTWRDVSHELFVKTGRVLDKPDELDARKKTEWINFMIDLKTETEQTPVES